MSPTIPTYNAETEEQVITPTLAPAVKLDEKLKDELLTQVQEENVVILHCSYDAVEGGVIRIWNSTFLVDEASGNRSKLLHAENISFAPTWTLLEFGATFRFTLIFSPLPKTCEMFTLFEDIPEEGGFLIKNIKRNKSDIYHVKIV